MQLPTLYKTLLSGLGEQHWWPVYSGKEKRCIYKPRTKLSGRDVFEIAIGAILTQNTSWSNVEKALGNLSKANALSLAGTLKIPEKKLSVLIIPSRYGRQKARYLKAFARHIKNKYKGSIFRMFERPLPQLREELISLKGIGNETADSMLLYAGNRPVFVVDAYTKRILERFYGREFKSYHSLQEFCTAQIPGSVRAYQEFHALLVALGKDICKPKPLCGKCALRAKCGFGKGGR